MAAQAKPLVAGHRAGRVMRAMEQRRALSVAHPELADKLGPDEVCQRAEGDLLGRGMSDDTGAWPTGRLRRPQRLLGEARLAHAGRADEIALLNKAKGGADVSTRELCHGGDLLLVPAGRRRDRVPHRDTGGSNRPPLAAQDVRVLDADPTRQRPHPPGDPPGDRAPRRGRRSPSLSDEQPPQRSAYLAGFG